MILSYSTRFDFTGLKMSFSKIVRFLRKILRFDSFTIPAVIMKWVDTEGLSISHPNAPYSSVNAYTRSILPFLSLSARCFIAAKNDIFKKVPEELTKIL